MAYRTSKETQLRKDEKKAFIMQTAVQIFSERGYQGTTVAAIVKASQTSVGSFYFYFPNKEALFENLYNQIGNLFQQISDFALTSTGGMVRGFCRSKTAELWAFQNFRGLAKAMMVEAAGLHPRFEQKRAEIINQSNERIVTLFTRMKQHGKLSTADARIAALLCNGTQYSIVMDWLQRETTESLTDFAFPIITYNLNAFKIPYADLDVNQYITETLTEVATVFSSWRFI